jgi:hypothetical protein
MCESAIMAGTTMDIRIGTQVITAIAEGSTATGIIATAVGIIIEQVTTTHRFLGAAFVRVVQVHVGCNIVWRREWDSNPRILTDRRFSRPVL